MAAIDTNVIVRLIARDNPDQLKTAAHFLENGAWVSVLVLAEAMWVLDTVYGRSDLELMDAIEMLLKNKNVFVQDSDAVIAALELYRSKPSLGFTDCLILELARKAGQLPLGTFGRNLARVPGTQKL